MKTPLNVPKRPWVALLVADAVSDSAIETRAGGYEHENYN
jgi:hypothetical protein